MAADINKDGESRSASPLLPAEVVIGAEHQEEAQDGGEDHDVSRQHQSTRSPRNHGSAGEDDGQAERRHHDACGQEHRQLLTGITGRVGVLHHTPRDAVRERTEDVEEEQEQRPVRIVDR